MTKLNVLSLSLVLVLLAVPSAFADTSTDARLQQAIASSERSPNFVARDTARHPEEELTFFGIKSNMTVVEIWPSGGYWAEILVPYLQKEGKLYEVLNEQANLQDSKVQSEKFRKKFAAYIDQNDGLVLAELGPHKHEIAPPGSADLVLTFRNLHNWMKDGFAEAALESFYRTLKPGGILGIEEHRARNDEPQDPKALNGYVREDYTIALAKKVGFELVDESDVNANTKDTKDWPKGVWTLAPVFAMGDVDREKYERIGEADNFVLKFRKPAQ